MWNRNAVDVQQIVQHSAYAFLGGSPERFHQEVETSKCHGQQRLNRR